MTFRAFFLDLAGELDDDEGGGRFAQPTTTRHADASQKTAKNERSRSNSNPPAQSAYPKRKERNLSRS